MVVDRKDDVLLCKHFLAGMHTFLTFVWALLGWCSKQRLVVDLQRCAQRDASVRGSQQCQREWKHHTKRRQSLRCCQVHMHRFCVASFPALHSKVCAHLLVISLSPSFLNPPPPPLLKLIFYWKFFKKASSVWLGKVNDSCFKFNAGILWCIFLSNFFFVIRSNLVFLRPVNKYGYIRVITVRRDR